MKTNGEGSKDRIESAAGALTTLVAHPDEERPATVDVIARQKEPSGAEAIAGEARKGYDLLVVGIDKTRHPKGGFSKDISLVTKGFEGPLAVVDSSESRPDQLPDRYGKILLPVNGTEISRRAAEVAMTLARASDVQVTALYVTRATVGGEKRKNAPRRRALRRTEQAVLKEIGALADHYGVRLSTTTRVNTPPDEAILEEAKRGYDLIVLGVSRRPGETLFFGNTAGAVLDRSGTSNLFVAS